MSVRDDGRRFLGLGGDYARYRPGYPTEAVDAIVDGLDQGVRAAEVGAGTGIMARLLADRGLDVIAVEPNGDMRASAEPHRRIRWQDAKAESLGLDDASVDLVVVAQAMHWFDAERAVAEFARVLRPHGRLAILWNLRDVRNGLGRAFQEVMEIHGDREVLMKSAEDRGVPPMPGFGAVERLSWRHSQRMDLDALLGRARSATYAPKDEPGRSTCFDELTRRFRALADRQERCAFPYETVLYRAEKL